MTLPTIQPVDWPDWGVAPTFQLIELGDDDIGPAPVVAGEILCGYSSYVTVYLTGDGDGSNQSWTLGWYTASTSEGGALVVAQTVMRPFGYSVTVPMSAYAPSLRLVVQTSDTFPFGYTANVVLMSQPPNVVGFPGGVTVINTSDTVPASSNRVFIPNGCAPGDHEIRLKTTGTSWNVVLRQFWSNTGTTDLIIATGAAAGQTSVRFLAPASAWDIQYQNLNAGDDAVELLINRLPW